MKDFLKYTLATVTGIIAVSAVIMFLGIISLIGMLASEQSKPKVKYNSVFVLSLSGAMQERSEDDVFSQITGNAPAVVGLEDVLNSIRKAKDDDNIKGIYIEAGMFVPDSPASTQAIRKQLADFKESGKWIVAYADAYTQSTYYICSVADKVLLNPQGVVDWRGLAAQPIFLKDLMAKFGVKMQLAKVGKAVDKDEWLMNPQTVNAYYEPSMNVIVFPAAILQPPFFNPDAEDAANYGGIGAVIGHEIGHGFDDQGSQYDGDGKLNDWWTEEDKANFKALTQKLIDQYNEFVPTQLAEKYSDDPSKAPHVNGALTIGENIGDLSGVNIALKAYAFALDEAAGRGKDGSTEAIEAALADAPEIDGFTGLQRFFLSYASIWRTKNRDELAEQYLQIDPHSPAECRTNGIARNVDLFHKAFGVQPGDGMWLAPEQRVRIW